MTISQVRRLKEAAELLSVSRATLYREWQRGHIAFVKVGNATGILDSEIARYQRDRTRQNKRRAA